MNSLSTQYLDETLHRLCQDGKLSNLQAYFKKGFNGDIDQGDIANGNSPLHHAAMAPVNSSEIAKLLLDFGANPAVLNDANEMPIHHAARHGNVKTMKLLVDRGGLSGILYHMERGNGSTASSKKKQKLSIPNDVGDVLFRRVSSNQKLKQMKTRSAAQVNNLLLIACEAENSDCAEYLIDEIIKARKQNFQDLNCHGPNPRKSETLDVREFLDYTEPKSVVFYELGSELVASNEASTPEEIESCLYGKLLHKTPHAFRHLLDSCIYKIGRKTFVDFFPFYNRHGGSELNLLKIIIHYKKFNLLTHPVCELFLHLKWLKARWLFWIVMILYLLYCVLVICYATFNYGQLGWYFNPTNGNVCQSWEDAKAPTIEYDEGSLYCIGNWFKVPVLVSAILMTIIQTAKLLQEGRAAMTFHYWSRRPEEFVHFLAIVLIIVDQLPFPIAAHRIVAAFMVLASCNIMMHTIARDPDSAIFVEMVSAIQKSLFRFLVSYIWLFIGWVIVFYITLGENSRNPNGLYNSFHDLGSAIAKVLAMFTGEIGYETAFSWATDWSGKTPYYNMAITVLYTVFIVEMCIVIMNLTIGLAISNIQDMRHNADALRLVKEVLLERYLESLLRISNFPCLSCSWNKQESKPNHKMGKLVSNDIFEGQAMYSLEYQMVRGSLNIDSRVTLTLVSKEANANIFQPPSATNSSLDINTTKSNHKDQYTSGIFFRTKEMGVMVPNSIVSKLGHLIEQRIDVNECNEEEDCDVKKALADLRHEIEELRKTGELLVEITNRNILMIQKENEKKEIH